MMGSELKVVSVSARRISCVAGVAKEPVCGFPPFYTDLSFFLSPSHGSNHISEGSYVTDG